MSATQTAAAPAAAPIVPPLQPANHFVLSGHDVHVEYAPTSFAGQPTLTYSDAVQTRSFSGSQIAAVDVADLGTMVSVTLSIVPDAGRTTFSVLIPHVQLSGIGTSSPVRTEGVRTFHRTSLLGHVLGQVETYTFVALHGTANHLIF